MNRYLYEGPVLEFDQRINEHWVAETVAPSEAKAKSNLTYRFKKSRGKSSDTKISLPGKITLIS